MNRIRRPLRNGRLLASTFALALAPAAAFGVAALSSPAPAEADVSKAQCRVNAVLASKQGDGKIPENLQFLKKELSSDQFAAFKSFRLLDAKADKLTANKAASQKLKSGHKVGLKLLGGSKDRPKVHVSVNRDGNDKALVSTDYTIKSAGFLLLAGFKHPDGKVIFAIQCKGE